MTKWRAAETPDERDYKPEKGVKLPVKQVREHKIEIQVKNNPFVKKVPTAVQWFLIEKSSNKIQIRTLTKNSEVPFCDSFMIEMELLVLGMDRPNASCCIVRQTQQIIWLKFCMMKAVVRSNTESETKVAMQNWEELYAKHGFGFVEPHLRVKAAPKAKPIRDESPVQIESARNQIQSQSAPELMEQVEEEVDTEDYTKAVDLKKLFATHEMPKGHILVFEQLIGLNCDEFFEHYLSDNAKHSHKSFYERKGENDVTCESWTDPITPEDKNYDGKPVLKMKALKMKVNVNSTFVKVAPTTKYFKLLERTPTKIVLRMLNRTSDIPYCATFGVEEEWFLASPGTELAKCSVLRMSFNIIWYQSTLMKSVIKSNTEPETKKVMGEFMEELLTKNNHRFVEKSPKPKTARPKAEPVKKPVVIDQRAQGKKISHRVESGNKLVHD
jgi:hypothetical protein